MTNLQKSSWHAQRDAICHKELLCFPGDVSVSRKEREIQRTLRQGKGCVCVSECAWVCVCVSVHGCVCVLLENIHYFKLLLA